MYETNMNFEKVIFSSSSEPLISAKVDILVEVGPVGISMRMNHKIGSLGSRVVLVATNHTVMILILSVD
jgi:hypothetical protein